ncbi:MAG: GMC family oxidoreductase [Moorea sp. SIO2B7]|nr:GMC family oxidoreductase [Moorena sp. SIO2B7]
MHFASKLASSKRDLSVLLLEAGAYPQNPKIHTPKQWYQVLLEDKTIEWGYQSIPQINLNNRIINTAQAKTLGGCSVHNATVYVRGANSDYNQWETQGCIRWGWNDVLPHFERVENSMKIVQGNSNEFIYALFTAAQECGLPYNSDYNTNPSQYGSALFQFTINPDNLRRETSYDIFVAPILDKKNLTVTSQVLVKRILLDSTSQAYGVEYINAAGEVITVYANNEVILSAGAIGSPKILMLSGIGNAQDLAKFDIPIVANLPGVGQKLHDELFVNLAFSSSKPLPEQPYGLMPAVLFGSTKYNYGDNYDDLLIDVKCSIGSGTLPGINLPAELKQSYWIWPNILHLQSTGSVKLQSAAPTVAPLIDLGYLTVSSDLQKCIEGLKLGREIGNSSGLADWRVREILPGEEVSTDQEIADYIKQTADSTHHYTGSCKMGNDEFSVVNSELKVRGVKGLRVIDSSIVPSPVTGNTAAVSMMIADKGGDMILESL